VGICPHFHAEFSRFVACGSDDAALARSADGNRFAAEPRIVALLHRGVESIHVDMEDLALPGGLVRDVSVRIYGGAPRPIAITILRKHETSGREASLIYLIPPRDNLGRIAGKRPLQLERFLGWRIHPDVDLLPRRQNDGHRFRVDRRDLLFGSVVRNAKISFVVPPSFNFRTEVQRVQMPAKKANGRVSSKANQTAGREPSGSTSFSEKLVQGTTQRFSIPSQRRQCGDLTLRMLVTPGSERRQRRSCTG
jgi:hypothetical protein